MNDIVSPCHSKPLLVLLSYDGYAGEDRVSEILCTEDGCFNSWEPDGSVPAWRTD